MVVKRFSSLNASVAERGAQRGDPLPRGSGERGDLADYLALVVLSGAAITSEYAPSWLTACLVFHSVGLQCLPA